jgi:hypothetical protein
MLFFSLLLCRFSPPESDYMRNIFNPICEGRSLQAVFCFWLDDADLHIPVIFLRYVRHFQSFRCHVIRGTGKETTGNDVKSLKTLRQNFGDARTKIGEREPILFSSLRTSLLSPQSTIASTIDLYLIPGTFVGSNSTYTSLSSIKGRDKAVGKFQRKLSI